MLLDNLPPAPSVRCVGRALVHDAGRTVGERPIDHIGVTGNPAHIRGTPVGVAFGPQIEYIAVREGGLSEISAGGVQNPLWLTRGAARVENEERMLRGESLWRVLGAGVVAQVVPPVVATLVPIDFVAASIDDNHVANGGLGWRGVAGRECGIHHGLQRQDLAFAVATVCGDDDCGLRIVDSTAKAFGREPTEDNGVWRTDSRAGQHGRRRLGYVRHVDRNAVTSGNPEVCEGVRNALDIVGQFGIGD